MDPVEIVLSVIVGAMLLTFFLKGASSEDPNTSCLTLLSGGCLFVTGGLFGLVWGAGKLVGWW